MNGKPRKTISARRVRRLLYLIGGLFALIMALISGPSVRAIGWMIAALVWITLLKE